MKQRATPYTTNDRDKTERLLNPQDEPSDVHALRGSSPVKTRSSSDTALLGADDDREDSGDDEDDDLMDDLDEAAAHAAFRQEQAEMRAQFTFAEERKKTVENRFMASMRRKRRMLARNENLRFRELHKPPEPIATKYAYSPLHIAVRFEHEAIVRLLLATSPRVKVNAADNQVGCTPLHLAILQGNIAITKLLLEDTNAQQLEAKNGTTPIELAAELKRSDMQALLVDHATRSSGRTQLANWLASIGLVEYAPRFFNEGFDDPQFLLGTGGLNDKTLDAMHIQKAGHRAKLHTLYQLKEFLHIEADEEGSKGAEDEDEEESLSGEDSHEGESESDDDDESESDDESS
ncbi:hypothetical protein BBO99_00004382 [Phytophthora kernoviae]|uniref:SAM domain-containing protein n=2 Tax=Phytophthora kernoviae TaxID=325452 RepID=A0A3R7G223_9STRA|nr:hypothetical protein G195_005743 [Phytophthora kernoviae 00238/432]KAG2524271.1 hypothetical protein JM16_005059 [Phytophthora kernoviae]KAG2526077.1 hypothetical protein JM18_004561 [Phytophthora kernoviae]RLN15313.1 hypothetical protein BBI17_004553 [Phytophthora kernoviae]RLN80610.1 hypothetical protein BBO99_00004382 [Phytophthora kernoviae]